IAKSLLLGLGFRGGLRLRRHLCRIVRHLERCGPNNLGNPSAADALRAYKHRLMATVRGRDVYALQVRLERAPADAGHLRTDATQILLLTARRDPIAHLRTF